jgi:hypothetical protein
VPLRPQRQAGEAAGDLAHQHGQRMLELGLLALQGQGFGLGGRHLGLHARHVQLGHIAGLEALLDQVQGLAVGRQTGSTSPCSA